MLLQSHSPSNKSTSTMLHVRYVVELIDYAWYRITRVARKTYAYMGMTREAANLCASAMRAQYTRTHVAIDENTKITDPQTGLLIPVATSATSLQAQIAVNCESGDDYSCTIDVDETDIVATRTAPADPALLFPTQNAWPYDETALIGITGVTRDAQDNIKIAYTCDASLDAQTIACQYKATDTSESWSYATITSNISNVITIPSTVPSAFCRLKLGSLASSPAVVPPPTLP